MTKFTQDEWLSAWLSHAKGEQTAIDLPEMPDPETQKLTNNKSGYETIEHAIPFYQLLCNVINSYNIDSSAAILDLGAGWGRFSALLSQQGFEQHAVDVEAKLVEAGKKFLPDVAWSIIDSGKAMAYPDNRFDLVFSNSVFSHLSKDSHLHSVSEVARVLKPGGIFVATTLSQSNLKNMINNEASKKWISSILGDIPTCMNKLANNEFIYAPTARWKDYGIAVIPEKWLINHWPSSLMILKTVDDNPDRQTVTIARKNPD